MLADLIPSQTVIIDSYSWELTIWQARYWQIYPPSHQMVISQIPTLSGSYLIPTLTAHIRQTRCWQIYPSQIKQQSQIPTLRPNIWQTKCWQIYPPSNGDFADSFSDGSYVIPILIAYIWQTRCWQNQPPREWQFNRFLLWHLILHAYYESSYLAEKVLAEHPHFKQQLYIPTVRPHIWQISCWQIYPPMGQTVIIDSYSES